MSDKTLEIARKRFAQAEEADQENRRERVNDIKFVRLGEQWPESVKRDRERPGAERPMLTINRLLQFRNQIVNEIRQNCPSVKFRPENDEADVETAEIYNGLYRHIHHTGGAKIAYVTAAENQVDTGIGYFRIYTDYCDSDSFDQEIKFKRILDSNSVYFDPNSTEPDGSDSMFAFVIEDVAKDDFKKLYPQAECKGWDDDGSGWVSKDNVRVADYLYIDIKTITICQMQDGSTINKNELPEEFHPLIVKERKSEKRTCKICKIGGNEILEDSEMPCSYIPVIPVIGSEVYVEGKRTLYGLTRPAKDSQRLYNYMETANTELLGLAPRAPYVVAAGQIDGYENEWQAANRVNLSVLTYNPVSDLGTLLPAPRREMPPGQNPGFESAMNRAAEDIKATMGIYDASVGNREGDQSGKAINSQIRQGQVGNYHFQDNLALSVQQCGKIIAELIPTIYDTARIIKILGEDGSPKSVKIDPNAPEAVNKTEDSTIYNLNKGKYHVVSDVGPSFATRRQEAAEAQIQMCQADPTLMQIAGDIIISNMDWPGADDIAKRKKAMLPPQIQAIIDADNEEGQKKLDPQVEMQMNQMADQVEHLSAELQSLQAQAESKEEELEIKRFEAETKRLEVQHKIALESTDLTHRLALEQVNAELMKPNNGESEDVSDEQDEKEEAKPQEPTPPHPDLLKAINDLKDTHSQTQAIIGAINKPKRIIRGADGRPEGIE